MPLIAWLWACGAPPVALEAAGTCAPWSDPATWGGEVPGDGACVTVPAGRCVRLDVPEVHLASLEVDGRLEVERRDVALTADWITVRGAFEAGTPERPFEHALTIALVADHARLGFDDPEQLPSLDGLAWAVGCPDGPRRVPTGAPPRSFSVLGAATLDLHGAPRGPAWVQLARDAAPGDRELVLTEAVDWAPGDLVAVASSDVDPGAGEEVEVAAVRGATIALVAPLARAHSGSVTGADVDPGGLGVDTRAEVARLTRNVRVVTGDPEPVPLAGRCTDPACTCWHRDCHCPEDEPVALAFHGGQLRVEGEASGAPVVRVQDVELAGLGRYGELGQYPVHLHELAHPLEVTLRRNVVHGSANRAFVVHGTAGVLLEDNVAWDVVGSAFYLERSSEGHRTHDNRLIGNLAGSVRACNPLDEVAGRDGPGAFWAADPENEWVGNVSAGSDFAGFYLDLRNGDPCDAEGEPASCAGTFTDNRAHASISGFYANQHHDAAHVLERFTAWGIDARAIWVRNHGHTELVGPRVARSGVGLYIASHAFPRDQLPTFDVRDALFVGPGVGVELYQGRLTLEGAVFSGYPAPSAAFGGHTDFLFYDNDPLNSATDVTLVDAHPLWFEPPVPGSGGTSSVALYDRDGSVGGRPGSWYLPEDPFHWRAGATVWREELGAIEVPAEVGLVQLLVEWVDPDEPVPTAWGRARRVDFERLEDGEVLEAELSKDGVHRQQALNLLAGTEVRVRYRDKGGDEVDGFDEVTLWLRHGPPGASARVHVPLEDPRWEGAVARGGVALDPSEYTFDPDTRLLTLALALDDEGGQDVVVVTP